MLREREIILKKEDVKISPFALVDGEILEFIPENKTARNIWLYDIQKSILIFINNHLWLSSKMIIEHFPDFDPQVIKNHIKFLLQNAYLRAAIFKTATGRSSARVYCLGYKAKIVLAKSGIIVNRYNELEHHTACVVKEIMSANQVILKVGLENNCTLRKPIFTSSSIFNKKCFRVAGYAESENHNILFNSIRTHTDVEISEKANRMYDTLKRSNSISTNKKSTIIVCICDSEAHKEKAKKIIENSKLTKLRNIKIVYFHDTEVNFGNGLHAEFLMAV